MGFRPQKCFKSGSHESAQMLGQRSIMLRWRSSLWKLIWKELILYVILFIIISLIYRQALGEEDQLVFEKMVRRCIKYQQGLPLTFLLGFYVSLIVKRWWEQYVKLPWPDTIAYLLRGVVIEGDQEQARKLRKTITRYTLLSYLLCMRRNSLSVQKKYPTMKEIVKSDILREDEAKRIGFEDGERRFETKWWYPLKWNSELVHKALSDGIITSASGYTNLLLHFGRFRDSLNEIESYGHIAVPLVYTQVVTLAVYVYFGISLVGDQVLINRTSNPLNDPIHIWLPIFLSLKFLFFFGWLKVAETLYNPFGDDDEDFSMNEMLARHGQVCYEIIEDNEGPPPLMDDPFDGKFDKSDEGHGIAVDSTPQVGYIENNQLLTSKA